MENVLQYLQKRDFFLGKIQDLECQGGNFDHAKTVGSKFVGSKCGSHVSQSRMKVQMCNILHLSTLLYILHCKNTQFFSDPFHVHLHDKSPQSATLRDGESLVFITNKLTKSFKTFICGKSNFMYHLCTPNDSVLEFGATNFHYVAFCLVLSSPISFSIVWYLSTDVSCSFCKCSSILLEPWLGVNCNLQRCNTQHKFIYNRVHGIGGLQKMETWSTSFSIKNERSHAKTVKKTKEKNKCGKWSNTSAKDGHGGGNQGEAACMELKW